MQSGAPSSAPEHSSDLKEREIVQHYSETGNAEFISELLKHHEGDLRRSVQRTVFRGGFCPAGWDAASFADAAFSLAQFNFYRRICGFLKFRSSFSTWLSLLARSAVLDEYKAAGKFKEIPGRLQDDMADTKPKDSKTMQDYSPPEFRSEHLESCWWLRSFPPQHTAVMAMERKSLVLRLLIEHAMQSDENLASSQTIRLRYWRDWSLAQLGLRLYGVPWSDREKNRQEQAVRRMLEDDYQKLHFLLKESFGITALRHI